MSHVRTLILSLISCATIGCGSNDNTMTRVQQKATNIATNYGDGYSFDEQSTNTGVRLRLGGTCSVHIDEVDRTYLWTAEHMQISPAPTPGPLVIEKLRSLILDDKGIARDGLYRPNTDTILITDSLCGPGGISAIDPSTNSPLVDQIICHESVHRILKATTGDPDNDHHSPYFNDCFSVFLLPPGEHG